MQKVTPWNADRLRKAILNGPYVYPGAVRVEDVHGVTHLDRPVTRRAIAKKLCSSSVVSGQHRLEGKVVHRHLQDGDILLVNRQVKFPLFLFSGFDLSFSTVLMLCCYSTLVINSLI